jgi:hypothetical protein
VRSVVRVVLAHVVAAGVVHADDGAPLDVSMDDLAVRESSTLFHDPGEPQLKLDIIPRPAAIGLGVLEDTQRTALRLGKRAMITASGTSWKGYADAVPFDGNESDIANGRRTAVGFHYDFGWLQLDAELARSSLSSRFGPSGTYRDVSLRLSKSHRFSRWVTGWIALSVGRRIWEGEPPEGEEDSTFIMLSIGGTFR